MNELSDLFLNLALARRDRHSVSNRVTSHVSYKEVIRSHFLCLQIVQWRHADDKLLPIPVRLYDSTFRRRDRNYHDLL